MLRAFTFRARGVLSRSVRSLIKHSKYRNIVGAQKRFSSNPAPEISLSTEESFPQLNDIQEIVDVQPIEEVLNIQNVQNVEEVHIAPIGNSSSSLVVHTNIDLEGLTIWNPFQTINFTHTQLRENCRCDMCTVKPSMHRNPQFTHQFFIDHDFDNNISIKEAHVDENDEYIYLKWSDMHEGWISIEEILHGSACGSAADESIMDDVYIAEEVRDDCTTDTVTDELNVEAKQLQQNKGYGFGNGIVHFWKGSDFSHKWEEFDFNDIMTNNASVLDLYRQLDKYGITLVRNCFASNSTSCVVENIGKRLGSHLYPTIFGNHFTVETVVDAVSPAYTNIGLLCHTDLPYYESVPEFFIFHCLVQECEYGGDSVYVDGFKVANEMRIHFPDEFEILSTVSVPFRDHQRGLWDMYSEKCIFEIKEQDKNSLLSDKKVVQRVYYNEGVRCSLHWNIDNKVKKDFYHALKICTQMAQNPDFQYLIKMEAGDAQIFCNTRLLHGRKEFIGKRIMQGGYFQRDSMMGKRREIQQSIITKNVSNNK